MRAENVAVGACVMVAGLVYLAACGPDRQTVTGDWYECSLGFEKDDLMLACRASQKLTIKAVEVSVDRQGAANTPAKRLKGYPFPVPAGQNRTVSIGELPTDGSAKVPCTWTAKVTVNDGTKDRELPFKPIKLECYPP